MGIFDWFRRRPTIDTLVWLTRAEVLDHLVQTVRDDLAAGRTAIVVAHFPDTLIEVGKRLTDAGVDFETLSQWRASDVDRVVTGDASPQVLAVLARTLPGADGREPPPAAAGASRVAVRACELHLLAEENQRLPAFVERLPPPRIATIFVALDDPHLKSVARDWVRPLMRQLGLAEGEPIKSRMVARAIERTLAKVARKATGSQPANSMTEWLQRNLPE